MKASRLCADLHVHSKYSKRPSQWVLQKIGCPESFTEPLTIYNQAKSRGMDLVTITDHNTIEARSLVHRPPARHLRQRGDHHLLPGGQVQAARARPGTSPRRSTRTFPAGEGRYVFDLVPRTSGRPAHHPTHWPTRIFGGERPVDSLPTSKQQAVASSIRSSRIERGTRDAFSERHSPARHPDFRLTPVDIERLVDTYPQDRALRGTAPGSRGSHGRVRRPLLPEHRPHAHRACQVASPPVNNVSTPPCSTTGMTSPGGLPRPTPRTMAHNLYGIAYQLL